MALRFPLSLRPFVFGAALLFTCTAHANGRIPAAGQLVLSRPGTAISPTQVLLRTTFGVALSADNGTHWDWVCEPALGFSGVQDPTFGATSEGYVWSAFEGAGRSEPAVCNATMSSEFGGAIDLVVDPANPARVVIVASKYDHTDADGNMYYANKIASSSNGGATYTSLAGSLGDTFRFETVELAKSDSSRLYVSGFRGAAGTGNALVARSTDGGATFQETAIPLVGDERGVYLATVDPVRADVVYARTAGTATTPSRLLVSTDGGVTFQTKRTLAGPMLGFALTPDGKSLFVGGLVDRLLYAAVPDLIASPGAEFAFEKRANVQVQCLATDGATLWACSNEVSGFLVGASTDGGQSFTRKLGLSTLRGVASCPANARTAQCNALWPAQANELGIVVDAGAPVVDGGIVQDASTSLDASCTDCAASPPKSCGCTEVGNLLASESSPWAFTAAMAAALTTALRRRWGVKRRL